MKNISIVIFDKEVMRNLGKTLRMLGTELYDEH